MKTGQWMQIKALFDEAIELPAAERDGFLAAHCDDPALRRQESLMLLADSATDAGLDGIARDAADDSFGQTLGPGDTVGAYRIVREFGRGGMGAVYLAERADRSYLQNVAIEVTNLEATGDGELRNACAAQLIEHD